jgi:hypothetical protein
MQAKEVNETLVVSELISLEDCSRMCLAYIKDFPGRQETVECLDLLFQISSQKTDIQSLTDLHQILLQNKQLNLSQDNRDTMSSSSETSQLLTDQNTLMSSLAANYIKLDSLPKPYDTVFELI